MRLDVVGLELERALEVTLGLVEPPARRERRPEPGMRGGEIRDRCVSAASYSAIASSPRPALRQRPAQVLVDLGRVLA